MEPIIYPYKALILCAYWLYYQLGTRDLVVEYGIGEVSIPNHITHTTASLLTCFVPLYRKLDKWPNTYEHIINGRYYCDVVDSIHTCIN